MKPFDRATIFIIRACLSLFGQRKRDRVLATITTALAPVVYIDVNHVDIHIRIACNSRQSLYWARNFFTHEPETINWIRSFAPGEVFWDVGANVGIYSLFAAINSGAKVMAFEPMTESHAALQRNVRLNGQGTAIDCFCIALSGSKSISRLRLDNAVAGSDSHEFIKHNPGLPDDGLSQIVFSLSVDEFIGEYAPSFPNHLKIDVDGPELEILQGATETLQDSRVKSVLVEGDMQASDKNREIDTLLGHAGFVNVLVGSTAGSDRHCNYLYQRETA